MTTVSGFIHVMAVVVNFQQLMNLTNIHLHKALPELLHVTHTVEQEISYGLYRKRMVSYNTGTL